MLKISILAIGDELCIGQVVNNNAAWLAAQCTKFGAKIILHATVGDEKDMMLMEIKRLMELSDLVITTGGLGPTHDDITKPVLAEFFCDKLAVHEPTMQYLTELYKKRNIPFSDRNKMNVMLPTKCKVLPNTVGSAPGMLFERDGKYLISLPGVPLEMKNIMENHGLKFIENLISEKKHDVMLFKTLQTTGIFESALADLIGEPEKFIGDGTLAFLPSYRGVKLRIGVQAENFTIAENKIKEIEKHIQEKAGKYIFGYGEETLSSAIGELLSTRKETLAVAESCTGGLLGGAITDVSGASNYFMGGVIAYSNEIKMKILNVPADNLEKHGAVSEETALALAKNVREKFNTTYGIGITGVAGPTGGTEEKPVGTVWISLADKTGVIAKKFVFGTDRAYNREVAVGRALGMLYEKVKGKNK
ncbi:MAG: competence/damage-inducible protein A [FCB group bacterium]